MGNPINPSTGEKKQVETDWRDASPHPLTFTRYYSSYGLNNQGLGVGWTHEYSGQLVATGTHAEVLLPDGSRVTFRRGDAASPWQPDGAHGTLSDLPNGKVFTRSADDSRWQFDAAGRLASFSQINGWTYSFGYNAAGQLSTVTNAFGRVLQFVFDGFGRLYAVNTPDGKQIAFSYVGDRVRTAHYPDGSARSYLYGDARFPNALTGIQNADGATYVSFRYDAQGRAIETSTLGAQSYSIGYPEAVAQGSLHSGSTVDPTAYQLTRQITDPYGNAQTWVYQGGDGHAAVRGANGPYQGGQVAQRTFLAGSTLPESETDFLGITTLYAWDVARRLKVAETRAATRPEAQHTQTQWHPTLRRPVLVTEPGRTTAYTWDAGGNKLSENVTDAATGQSRIWTWTYNALGLMVSRVEPGGAQWTFEYDGSGNLTKITDPLGGQTSHTYDGAGRVLTQSSPGRAQTIYTYDSLGRLTSELTNGEATAYAYTPSGQLDNVLRPDGYAANFQYDDAGQLYRIYDNRGSSVSYGLDEAGKRTSIHVRDSLGETALLANWTVSPQNKVTQIRAAFGETTVLAYDANGELVSRTDPLNQTTRRTLDGLRRDVASTFADNASEQKSWNALNQVTKETDPKGVATQYTYNAFGEILSESSPDAGTIRFVRDVAGRVVSAEDARGQGSSTTYDALGRPTEIRRATDDLVHVQYNAAGDVKRVEDRSGSATYEHDALGRVTTKTQDVNDNPSNPARFKAGYAYTAGHLTGVTYPSGLKVTYQRDKGQITGISVQEPGRNKPVVPFVSNLTHTGLGQPKAWNWASGDIANRSYDMDGRMISNEFASYYYDAASRMHGVVQHLWASSTATGTVSLYTTSLAWTVEHDSRDRLVRFARPGSETTYTYDANSNRLTAIEKVTSDTDLNGDFEETDFAKSTSQILNTEPTSNRLLGFTQTLTTTNKGKTRSVTVTPVSYTVDAAGNLLSDGLRRFDYGPDNRISKARIFRDGEEASVSYLHNAMGQRVFKGEPVASQTLPDETELGTSFIDWLKKNFRWLFANAQANTSIGTAYIYGDGQIPSWALLGEYDNGSAKGAGRTEYIWLPTQDGGAIPIGMFRNGKFFAIHPDHLGTPRLMTNEQNQPVWQWPYSAFGNNKPTGVLKAAPNPRAALTNIPVLLKATAATEMGLRMPGQLDDPETGTFQNFMRSYWPAQGRYTQADPIGWTGGSNFFAYAGLNPLTKVDPTGLVPPILVPIVAATVGATAGGAGNYAMQKFWQKKCNVDALDVANAALWGALGGAAMPVSGGSLLGAAGIGATANLGQYFTGQILNGQAPTGGGIAWNAGTGTLGGAAGGAFARPVGHGAVGTALPQLARDSQTMMTLGANTTTGTTGRNFLGGMTGNVPSELPGMNDCTCRR